MMAVQLRCDTGVSAVAEVDVFSKKANPQKALIQLPGQSR